MLGQTDGNSLEPVPMVRVGLLEHVWVDPRDLTTMAEHCVRRATTSVAPMQQSDTLILADGETGVQEPDDDDVAMIHPTLRPWIVPRIWNNIHGHVVPAIWRSAMTCILAWLMKCPGARVSWLHDRLKLVFAKTEVIELVEQLEQRKAVVTQVVDGEMHVFLVEGFFYRIL
ncbi:hypothetical protein BCR44DRAFT_35784 [Catenaria anguillulae PL171]|uniref:Uncharacterized protein n=1 Tax=Catenaria anguillulae PL171 TaxID=765915 RepID=A0A1Y2HSH4_9FUNG|nr:hypothetical protein BCR44DRAFT_35784 [Catenaria anguillulae PL171]